METVLVQINDSKAYKLVKDLEDLKVLTVLTKSDLSMQKLSEKYAGKLPSNVADELLNYVNESRGEWNRSTI